MQKAVSLAYQYLQQKMKFISIFFSSMSYITAFNLIVLTDESLLLS